MRINHNMSAIRANMHLSISSDRLSKSSEKLASGYKINHAFDDPAGLAISNKMRLQIKSLKKATENTGNGISVMQIADGALEEVTSMIQRMNELSVKAANGTNSNNDRQNIQDEVSQLMSEIDRIAETTDYNTMKILNGDLDRRCITNTDGITMQNVGMGVEDGKYQIKIASGTDLNYLDKSNVSLVDTDATVSKFTDVTPKPVITVEGTNTNFKEESTTSETANDSDTSRTYEATGDRKFVKGRMLDDPRVVVTGKDGFSMEFRLDLDELYKKNKDNITFKYEYFDGTDTYTKTVVNGGTATYTDKAGNAITDADIKAKLDASEPASAKYTGADITVTGTVLDAGYATLQLGANTGEDMDVYIPKISTETLGIEDLDVTTENDATEAVRKVSTALANVSSFRSRLGAYQNRLESTLRNSNTTVENMTQSLSRVMDTDMAEEMTEYTQLQVLEQAGTSVLAEANQRPETILSILQS
ncbi:MAG: flagellin [Catonella sp.]|nr:flagellin [Catonella sp.]MDY6355862.1 flagellin [Catonella sp.]